MSATPPASSGARAARRAAWLLCFLSALFFPRVAPAQPIVTEPDPPAARWLVEGYVRYVTVPDFVVAGLFDTHTSMHSFSTGAGVLWRQPSGHEWRFSVDYLRLGFDAGNWLEASLPPASAAYLDWDLGFLSVAASYTWRFGVADERVVFFVGLGASLGVFLGDVEATDVIPTCSEPAASCRHWRWATRRKLELPTRVLALPIVHGGVDLNLLGDVWFRIEAGFFGIPFAGVALAVGI